MSWLEDLENKKKPKPTPKPKPKAVVTHTYPRKGEHTVKVKDLLKINVEPEEIWERLPKRDEMTNWFTRGYGKYGERREKSMSILCYIVKEILLEKVDKLL